MVTAPDLQLLRRPARMRGKDVGTSVCFLQLAQPWHRGSNETPTAYSVSTFPKGTSLNGYSQHDLDQVAVHLKARALLVATTG